MDTVKEAIRVLVRDCYDKGMTNLEMVELVTNVHSEYMNSEEKKFFEEFE